MMGSPRASRSSSLARQYSRLENSAQARPRCWVKGDVPVQQPVQLLLRVDLERFQTGQGREGEMAEDGPGLHQEIPAGFSGLDQDPADLLPVVPAVTSRSQPGTQGLDPLILRNRQ